MTQEEQAQQIVDDYNHTQQLNDGTHDVYTETAVLYMLNEMAKWKDEHPSQELKRQIVNKAVEWIKENITYTDNGIKKCLVNLGPFIDAMMEE